MNVIKQFLKDEDAIGIVEIILILVILIAIVAIFRKEIGKIVSKAFTSITKDSDASMKEINITTEG